MDKVLLKPEKAAEMMSLGRTKIFEMMARGELPSIRIGRARRIPTRAIEEWVEKQIGSDKGQDLA